MTPAAADWVYEHALTGPIRRSYGCDDQGPVAVRTCSCQWGPCGHCQGGRPDRCAHRQRRTRRDRDPAASILSRGGGVVALVWPVGRGCRWHCPGPTLADASQPALFALAGGAR